MHNNLPFKPLLITVALASLFPMGVANASTYGILANSQDLIIEDQNTFEMRILICVNGGLKHVNTPDSYLRERCAKRAASVLSVA